jgi:hypothetical protein
MFLSMLLVEVALFLDQPGLFPLYTLVTPLMLFEIFFINRFVKISNFFELLFLFLESCHFMSYIFFFSLSVQRLGAHDLPYLGS